MLFVGPRCKTFVYTYEIKQLKQLLLTSIHFECPANKLIEHYKLYLFLCSESVLTLDGCSFKLVIRQVLNNKNQFLKTLRIIASEFRWSGYTSFHQCSLSFYLCSYLTSLWFGFFICKTKNIIPYLVGFFKGDNQMLLCLSLSSLQSIKGIEIND